MNYSITKKEVLDAARSFLNVKWLHQGRDPQFGLDCVGYCSAVAKAIDYPTIIDMTDYGREPNPLELIRMLRANLDEIELSEFGAADILLMKPMQSDSPRHVAFCETLENDPKRGIEPSILHAANRVGIQKVIREPLQNYRSRLVKAFRIRGLV